MLDRLLSKRRQHMFIEAATKAFYAGKSHSTQFKGLSLVENRDLGCPQDFLDLVHMATLIVVISQHPDNGNPASAQVIGEPFRFFRHSKMGQVSAEDQHVRILRNLFEQTL